MTDGGPVAPANWLGAISRHLRRKRFAHFAGLLRTVPPPVTVLDVGGDELFWQQVDALGLPGLEVTLLNCEVLPTTHAAVRSVLGDARDMTRFADGAFDVVFSNSVIEHVGDLADQARMAAEVRRVGRRYYVQTPNRYFPIEPHFLWPFFQFYPYALRAWILSHGQVALERGTLRWGRAASYEAALAGARSIRLLNAREMRALFPGARLWRERVAGLTKSLVAYGNWH